MPQNDDIPLDNGKIIHTPAKISVNLIKLKTAQFQFSPSSSYNREPFNFKMSQMQIVTTLLAFLVQLTLGQGTTEIKHLTTDKHFILCKIQMKAGNSAHSSSRTLLIPSWVL
jgi:hypothetical protein